MEPALFGNDPRELSDERDTVTMDKDIALLMLYGHVLYSSQSYTPALNYFLRALSLDPANPIINLNIGLTYAQCALKREADNRQHFILQSVSFLFDYYESRKNSHVLGERLEANHNMGRCYSMLGLTHLAIPFYLLVLEEVTMRVPDDTMPEDLIIDAAYNLQSIYTMAGNPQLADVITTKWLVL